MEDGYKVPHYAPWGGLEAYRKGDPWLVFGDHIEGQGHIFRFYLFLELTCHAQGSCIHWMVFYISVLPWMIVVSTVNGSNSWDWPDIGW